MDASSSSHRKKVLILSDIHYACEAERSRGSTESKAISNPVLRVLVWLFRRFMWVGAPMSQNHFLNHILEEIAENPKLNLELVVANGDFTSDTKFIGVVDDPAFESAQIALNQLRTAFGDRFQPVYGDHEIGKMSLFGGKGGPKIKSWQRAKDELHIPPCWSREIGNYTLLGVTSTVLAQPVYEAEMEKSELEEWGKIRQQHLSDIDCVLTKLEKHQRLIIFCHDPSALNFLINDTCLHQKLHQVESTIIGHLHSPLILSAARMLAGMPTIHCLGNSIRRMSQALHEARQWECLKLRICPSVNGIRLLRDGGYYILSLDPTAKSPAEFEFHPTHDVPWTPNETHCNPDY
jgi:hypothetical protein